MARAARATPPSPSCGLPPPRPTRGATATIPLVATKGRASYLGERSAGHEDPGARSTALLLAAAVAAASATDAVAAPTAATNAPADTTAATNAPGAGTADAAVATTDAAAEE